MIKYTYRCFTADSIEKLTSRIRPFLDRGWERNPKTGLAPSKYYMPERWKERGVIKWKTKYWIELRKEWKCNED